VITSPQGLTVHYLGKGKPIRLLRLIVSLLSFGIGAECCALDWPLSPEVVREAYFFGRSSDRAKVAEFLGQYERVFQLREKNSFVGRIELHTPYQRVVQRSWETASNYSAQQAQLDYASESDIVRVRVFVYLDAGGPAPSDIYSDSHGQIRDRRENFWRQFQFRITQGHTIEPKKILGQPRYGRRGQGLSGAAVDLDLDASACTPGEMAIQVISPDHRTMTTQFDLARLK
jgi:hypothetical protein